MSGCRWRMSSCERHANDCMTFFFHLPHLFHKNGLVCCLFKSKFLAEFLKLLKHNWMKVIIYLLFCRIYYKYLPWRVICLWPEARQRSADNNYYMKFAVHSIHYPSIQQSNSSSSFPSLLTPLMSWLIHFHFYRVYAVFWFLCRLFFSNLPFPVHLYLSAVPFPSLGLWMSSLPLYCKILSAAMSSCGLLCLLLSQAFMRRLKWFLLSVRFGSNA